ncbi:MAG: KH domain-containing protein [Armatimonadetes bacterium]|nr:KH domain-containing protein [Armatimonadota bacterium]
MTSIEQTGNTVEEAIDRALEALNANRDEVEVEVLREDAPAETSAGAEPVAVRVSLRGTGSRPAPPAGNRNGEEGEAPSASAEFGERVRAVTQHIIDLMGLNLTATVTRADRQQVNIDLEGGDARIAIGKHGQTLEALQHLVGLIVNKDASRRRRVFIDAEGYQQRRRDRREQELLEMVRMDAQRAKETGQEAIIQYAIGPYERRIVHMAFVDDPDFTTYSEGEEPHRYVVISPRD